MGKIGELLGPRGGESDISRSTSHCQRELVGKTSWKLYMLHMLYMLYMLHMLQAGTPRKINQTSRAATQGEKYARSQGVSVKQAATSVPK